MGMAKIVKSKDAPEGDVKVSVGPFSFKLDDADGAAYETDEAAVIDAGETHPYLVVEYGEPDVDPKGEMKAVRKLHKEQEKADAANAKQKEKDPAAPLVEGPTSVADLKESK